MTESRIAQLESEVFELRQQIAQQAAGGVELAKLRTLASPVQMRDALRASWIGLFNDAPTRECLCVILAHWALETARTRDAIVPDEILPRGKACWNWNIGNEKYPSRVVAGVETIALGTRGDWQFYACNEVIGGEVVWFYPPNRGACFKAYRSLADGCAGYLGLLGRRYAAAWQFLRSGDPAGFSHKLKLLGYYTAPEADYTRAMVSLFREFLRLPAIDVPPTVRRGSTGEAVAKWQTLVGIEGEFGEKTEVATKAWQRAHNLVADGIVGPKTWAAAQQLGGDPTDD